MIIGLSIIFYKYKLITRFSTLPSHGEITIRQSKMRKENIFLTSKPQVSLLYINVSYSYEIVTTAKSTLEVLHNGMACPSHSSHKKG